MALRGAIFWCYCREGGAAVQHTTVKEWLQKQVEQLAFVPGVEEHTFHLSPEYQVTTYKEPYSALTRLSYLQYCRF